MAVAERELARRELTAPVQKAEADFEPQPYRWTCEQFHQAGEARVFEGQRVILIEGEILIMPPVGDLHCGVVTLASEALRSVFGDGFFVREEKPFDVGRATDPQPDIAVITGSIRDYLYQGITNAALIVEISDSTLRYDRGKKASLYASAGVTDYWLINIDQEPAQVEVHRQPAPDETQAYGFGYREKTIYRSGGIIHPLNGPKPVAIAALLP